MEERWREPAALAEQYAGMLYRLAYARTGSRADAEDVMQEVFVRLLRARPEFRDEEHAKAWLLRVGARCAADVLRAPWRRREGPLDDGLPAPEPPGEGGVVEAVLALPARGGRFYDWENNGMPEAVASLLSSGKLQLFTADGIDAESLLAGDAAPRRRAEMQEKYFNYLSTELAAHIRELNQTKKGQLIWCVGVDTGACQAVNCRLRRPEVFGGAIGLSGLYDMSRFLGSAEDDLVLRNAPLAYLTETGLVDKKAFAKAEENDLILCAGQGSYEEEAQADTRALSEALTAAGVSFTAITRDTNIIAQVVAGNGGVLGCFSAEQIATITEFSQHMNFLGIDLTRIPKLGLSLDIVLPLLSVITMLLSTHISMKASGQQMQGSMKLTMYMMPLMYLFFCFTYPLAFSLYYVISNIVMTVQTQVMRKVYDPEKMRKEIEAQIAEKKKQEKRGVKNTTVKVTDPKTGKTTEKNLSASEMNKHRLEYARRLDEERYKDERTVPLSELNKQDKE